jgi:hypothetical protein
VTNGSTTVVGSIEVDWTDAQTALQYGTPVYFMLLGKTEIPRSVIAVAPPATSASGMWELTLVSPWNDTTEIVEPQPELGYLIHKDFTVNLRLALATAGEQGWAQLFSRNMQVLDTAVFTHGMALPSPEEGQPGITTSIQGGQTLYTSGDLEIPLGSDLDILPGGAVEVG